MNQVADRTARAYWTFTDLGLFVASILPVYYLSAILVWGVRTVAPSALASDSARLLASQCALYVLLLGSLYLVLRTKYDEPFWSSLGWTMAFRWAWLYLLAGPALAFGISALDGVLHVPAVENPIDKLLGEASPAFVAVFITIAGPIFEELVFRGFLQPLLVRFGGAALGIVGASIPFALVHGVQYQWSWQILALLCAAGAMFGVARHISGSTAASALMHMGYNFTLFAAELLRRTFTEVS